MSIIYCKTLVLHSYLFGTLFIVNKVPSFQLFFFFFLIWYLKRLYPRYTFLIFVYMFLCLTLLSLEYEYVFMCVTLLISIVLDVDLVPRHIICVKALNINYVDKGRSNTNLVQFSTLKRTLNSKFE